jgi:lipopolysaccharide transport system permease protein
MAGTNSFTISPPNGALHLDLREIIRYRELLFTLVWKDIKVRYKQTFFGVAWALFQPFTTMIIFSIFFGGLAKVPSDGIPYPIFVYSGLLFWNYFSTALTNCSNSLIENENIIKKIYFPRLLLPLSAISTPIIDFLIAWVLLACMMVFFRIDMNILLLVLIPLLLLLSFVTAFGLGTFLAAVNSKYRDVRYILPFFIQLLLFVTPVIYPVGIVPDDWKFLLFVNPMTAVVESTRSILFATPAPNLIMVVTSVVSAFIILVVGLYYFKRTECYFADTL